MSEPASIEGLHYCDICGGLYTGRNRDIRVCPKRECRTYFAEWESFNTLELIVTSLSRWLGAPSQEEMRHRYYDYELRRAVRKLARSEDRLSKLLIEIIEDAQES